MSTKPSIGPTCGARLGLLSLLVLAAGACADEPGTVQPPQIMVRIHSTPEVREAMDAVRVSAAVEVDGDWHERDTVDVPTAERAWPIDIPVVPSKAKPGDERFEIVVEAVDEGVPQVQARAITHWFLEGVRILDVWLIQCGDRPLGELCEDDGACHGVECEVCVDPVIGLCGFGEEIDPLDLKLLGPRDPKPVDLAWPPDVPLPDGGGEPTGDGGTDAGHDAGFDAAVDGAVDAGFDAGVDAAVDPCAITSCDPVGCGDGTTQVGEACDDGNNAGGDGCNYDCTAVDRDFECSGSPCTSTAVCSNGLLDGTEQCDDSNLNPGDGCSAGCQVEAGWFCTAAAAGCIAEHGDGFITGKEDCDDGNTTAADGCGATGRRESGYACEVPSALCEPTVCADGNRQGDESCDDGGADAADGCNPQCQLEPGCVSGTCSDTCGDGMVSGLEACDDGDVHDGDGCSSTCAIELGWQCTLAALPSMPTLSVVYRDFIRAPVGSKHPDFEQFSGSGATTGLVQTLLGPGELPVFGGNCDTNGGGTCPSGQQLTTQANFNQWYRSVPAVNKELHASLNLTSLGPNAYEVNSGSFFPLDGMGWVVDGVTPETASNGHNFGFTTEIHFWFKYQGGEQLNFTGDDDFWAFINGRLAIDVGGTHSAQAGAITLNPGTAGTLGGLNFGAVYEVALFHAERHTTQSNFQLQLVGYASPKSVCATSCGDSMVAGLEECDLGPSNNGAYDGCMFDCKLAPRCGDQVIQNAQGEDCDPGTTPVIYEVNGIGCSPSCTEPRQCGDGFVDAPFGEQCDDGTVANDDTYGHCSSACKLGPRCGDGTKQTAFEQCDDGNLLEGDGCDAACQTESL